MGELLGRGCRNSVSRLPAKYDSSLHFHGIWIGVQQRDRGLRVRTLEVRWKGLLVYGNAFYHGATWSGHDDSGFFAFQVARLVWNLSTTYSSGILRVAVLHLFAYSVLPISASRAIRILG